MAKLNLENTFTYHPPFGDQPQRYQAIRSMGLAFARLIQQSTPPSREQSLAFTALEEVVMRANSAIAVNEVAPVVLDEVVVEGAPLDTPEGAIFAEAHLGVVPDSASAAHEAAV